MVTPREPFDYFDYLRSDEWEETREQALMWACERCQVCNSPDRLHVHHRTYERVGCEDLADLTVLCAECHRTYHRKIESIKATL